MISEFFNQVVFALITLYFSVFLLSIMDSSSFKGNILLSLTSFRAFFACLKHFFALLLYKVDMFNSLEHFHNPYNVL